MTDKNLCAMESEARGILILLGYDGVWDYAKRAGINHGTAGELLGTVRLKNRKKHNLVVKAHEALHSAYMDGRAEMSKAKRAYIRDWVKRWRKWVIAEALWLTSAGKVVDDKSLSEERRRLRKQQEVRAGVELAMAALKWE